MNLKLKEGSPIILVEAGSDETEFSTTRFAVVEFTKELFERIENLRMGREICGAYEVTKFDSSCDWLNEHDYASERGEVSLSDDQSEQLEEFMEGKNEGIWQIEPIGDVPMINDDCTQIHVSEFGIKFTAYCKHTNDKIWTERIPYELIYKLNF
jgi:hypothetical protein